MTIKDEVLKAMIDEGYPLTLSTTANLDLIEKAIDLTIEKCESQLKMACRVYKKKGYQKALADVEKIIATHSCVCSGLSNELEKLKKGDSK